MLLIARRVVSFSVTMRRPTSLEQDRQRQGLSDFTFEKKVIIDKHNQPYYCFLNFSATKSSLLLPGLEVADTCNEGLSTPVVPRHKTEALRSRMLVAVPFFRFIKIS